MTEEKHGAHFTAVARTHCSKRDVSARHALCASYGILGKVLGGSRLRARTESEREESVALTGTTVVGDDVSTRSEREKERETGNK